MYVHGWVCLMGASVAWSGCVARGGVVCAWCVCVCGWESGGTRHHALMAWNPEDWYLFLVLFSPLLFV